MASNPEIDLTPNRRSGLARRVSPRQCGTGDCRARAKRAPWVVLALALSSSFWLSTCQAADATIPPAAADAAAQAARAGASNTSVNDMEMLDDTTKLGKGDRVSFRVIEDEEEPKSLVVTDAGDIEVPYFGLVRASEKTCRQLAKEVKGLLERTYYYRATVIIAVELINRARVTGKVYVTGQVRSPGAQELLANETNTVSKVILRAGGFGDFADRKKVQVVRDTAAAGGGKKVFTINVADIWQKGETDQDLVLEPEDQIFVPGRLVNF